MRPIKLTKKEWGLGVLASILALGGAFYIPDPIIFVPMIVGSLLCCLYLAYHHEGNRFGKAVFVFVVAVILALISYRNLSGLRARVVVTVAGMISQEGNTKGCTIYIVSVTPASLPTFPLFGHTNTDNQTHQMSNPFPSDVTKGNLLLVGATKVSDEQAMFLPLDHLNVKMQFPNDINSFIAGTLNEFPRGGGIVDAEIGRNMGGECYPVQTTAVDDPSIVVTQSGPATLQINNGFVIPPGKTIMLFVIPYLNRHSFSPPADLSVEGFYDYAYNGITRHKPVEVVNNGISNGEK